MLATRPANKGLQKHYRVSAILLTAHETNFVIQRECVITIPLSSTRLTVTFLHSFSVND